MADLCIAPDDSVGLVTSISSDLTELREILESPAADRLSVEALREISDCVARWAMEIAAIHHHLIDRRTVHIARSRL